MKTEFETSTESLLDHAVEAMAGTYEERLTKYEQKLQSAESLLQSMEATRAGLTKSKDDSSLDRQRKEVRSLKVQVAYLQKKVNNKNSHLSKESFKPMSISSQFETTAQVISVEAFAGIDPSKIISRFPEFFSGLIHSCTAAISGLNAAFVTTGDEKEFQSLLQKTSYASLMDRPAFVPRGFSGTYLEYLKKIEPELAIAERIPKEVVAPFKTYVTDLLSRPEKLASVNPDQFPAVSFFAEIHSGMAQLEFLAKSANPEAAGEHTEYKKVVARNNDWSEIVRKIREVDQRLNESNPEKLLEEVTEAGDYLNRLIERVKEDPETYRTSAVQLDGLAQLVLNIARSVEFYAAVVYLYGRFRHCVMETRKELFSSIR
jgi:hypothetical protein